MGKPKKTSVGSARGVGLSRLGLIAALLAAAMMFALPWAAWAAEADLAAGSIDDTATAAEAQRIDVVNPDITTQGYNQDYAYSPDSYKTIKAGESVNVVLDDDNDYVQWFAFTPPERGMYGFVASNANYDPYGALYGAVEEDDDTSYDLKLIKSNDDSGDDYCFKIISPTLEAGETYYLACSDYSSYEEDSYTVSVYKHDPTDIACADFDYYHHLLSGSAASIDSLDMEVFASYWDESAADIKSKKLVYNTDYKVEGWYSVSYDDANNPVYTKLSSAPSAVGDYALKLVGSGSYSGSYYAAFYIDDVYDLENGHWYTDVNSVYAGSTVSLQSLGFTVYRTDRNNNKTTLKLGTDYKFANWYERVYYTETDEDGDEYTDWYWGELSSTPKDPGYYRVEVVGAGKYHGTLKNEFYIYDTFDLGDYERYCKDILWSNGKAVTLDRLGAVLYRVGDSKTKLTAGKHYKVKSWYEYIYDEEEGDGDYQLISAAPKAPGDYKVVVEGISPYKGERTFYFYIYDSSDISYYTVDNTRYLPNTGKAPTINNLGVSVYRTDEKGNKVTLKYGTDYTIGSFQRYDPWYDEDGNYHGYVALDSLSDVRGAGIYYGFVIGKGSYSGNRYFRFDIVDSKDLSYATVSGVRDEYYIGEAVPTNPTVVTPSGEKLKKGTHYTVTLQRWNSDADDYADAADATFKSAGSYRLLIQAKESSGYYSYCTKALHVYNAGSVDISTSYYLEGVPSSLACTGKALAPSVVVRSKSDYENTLVKGEDYTVSYSNNVFSGKATITVKGKGYYKGTLTATFTINKPAKGVNLTVGKDTYKVTKVGKEVEFVSTTATGKVKVPTMVKIGDTTYKVTSIAAKAFKGNKKVKSVVIGANVAKVGANAFKGAAKCKTVTIATPKLKKASIKNIIKGSKVKTLKLTGKAKSKKKAYQKFAGKKVKVK